MKRPFGFSISVKNIRFLYLLNLIYFLYLPLSAAATPPEASPVILIQNATILTVSHGAIEHGSILIKDGKIVEVGQSIKAPKDAQIIDAAGQFVIPGIIDCHSHIAAESINEGSVSVSSMVTMEEVLDPDDIDIYRDLAGGVTSANILHGSANSIGGQTLVIKLRWGQPAAKLPFEGAMPGIKFALGENPKRSNFSTPGQPRRYPTTRMGVEETIRAAFTEARDYKKTWDDYNKRAAGEKNLIPPRRDLKLEPLVEVLEGKRYVHSHCYREDEILMLLRVAKEFGFKVRTFQHVLEGYKVADELAAAGVGASTFSDWWAYKVEAYDAIPYNAALMTRRGVVVSINSDDAEEATHLNQEAAKSMKYGGLSHDEALKLVTLNPAIQLGIDKRVGSIDVGKDADLAIYNHDPMSAYAVVQKTIIDGRVYFDRERDVARRAEIEKEKKALTEKLKKAEKKPEDKKPDTTVPIGQKPGEKKSEEKKPEEKPKTPTPTPTPTVSQSFTPLAAASSFVGGEL
ncbi:MAG TPA: amidohydrolase family protein [Candidatus Angelobacter sp.]|nr:amidohydrolase family protein [Candidatus Angelobacter sp.]